jgi:hypothetical protein
MKPALGLALFCLAGIAAALCVRRPPSPEEAAALPEPAKRNAALPITAEQLVREVETVRGLQFRKPPVLIAVSAAELEKMIRDGWNHRFSATKAKGWVRMAIALGLTREPFDLPASLSGFDMEQPVAWYDDVACRLYFDKALNLSTRPDVRSRMVFEIARALALQNAITPLQAGQGSEDAWLAAENLTQGEAVVIQTRHSLMFPGEIGNAEPVPAVVPYYAAPPFLRSWYLFPSGMAQIFQAGLISSARQGKGMSAVLDDILAKPPGTTSEIMHPEHYGTPFVPEMVALPDTAMSGTGPMVDTVLGEYMTLLVLKSQLTQDESRSASEGWHGDRCLVYSGSGSGENRDHLLWKSRWTSEQDAKEFFTAIRKVLLFRNALLPQASYESDGAFKADEPVVSLRVRLTADNRGVVVISSPDKTFAEVLDRMEKTQDRQHG